MDSVPTLQEAPVKPARWRNPKSAGNALKNGKYMKIQTMHCNSCKYRSTDTGGTGQCPKYEQDATCIFDKELIKAVGHLDTRNSDHVKEVVNDLCKDLLIRTKKATLIADMEGDPLDRKYIQQSNALINALKVAYNLNREMKLTMEKHEYSELGELHAIGKSLKAELSIQSEITS